jgi:DNA-binding XRE family transcriptional regulator
MLELTKVLPTENQIRIKLKQKRDELYDWRDLFKEEIEERTEQGIILRGLRGRDGYTQAQLGKLIGVSRNNISLMEHGRRPIGKKVAQRLAVIFKVSYQRFL